MTGALAKNHKVGRIKEKYNPKPNAKEKRHHLAVMEMPCMGCDAEPAGVAHHPLMESPLQRWRRDHEFVVPVCHRCHSVIHDDYGDEVEWSQMAMVQLPVRYAEFLRLESICAGIL